VRAEPVPYDPNFSPGTLNLACGKKAALVAFFKASKALPLRREPHFEMGGIYP
jgi:hypothetical protein